MDNNKIHTSQKIIVTGAGGYIGSIITYTLLRNQYNVIAIDSFERGYIEPLNLLSKIFPNQLIIIKGDLRKTDLINNPNFNNTLAVIHCAAYCIVDESVKYPSKYIKDNPLMLNNVIKLMSKFKIQKLIFSSTAAVYGEPEQLPVNEKSKSKPINPYGESKLLCEDLINSTQSINSITFRYFNVCGASYDGLIGDSKNPSELLVQNAVRGALNLAPFFLTYSLVNTPDKSPIRDFVDVEDLAEAHILALKFLQINKGHFLFNLGSEKGYSVLEIVKEVEMATSTKINIKKGVSRQGEQARMIADSSKANEILNWRAKRNLKQSITAMIKWYDAHPKGWKK